VSVYGPAFLYFEPLKLLNFDLNADPDLAFHSDADPDPESASKNDADSCGSGSTTLGKNMFIISLTYFCSWP
jgi:hypothetical protein